MKVVLTTDSYSDPFLNASDIRFGRQRSGDPTWGCDGDHEDYYSDGDQCDCDETGAFWRHPDRSDPILVQIAENHGKALALVVRNVPAGAIFRIVRKNLAGGRSASKEEIEILKGEGWRIATVDPEPVPEAKPVVRQIRRVR